MAEFLNKLGVRKTFLTMAETPEAVREKTERFEYMFYKFKNNNNNSVVSLFHEGDISMPLLDA